MAIFSRRVLQEVINNIATFLSPKELRKKVDQLNNEKDESYLANEWEIVLLYVLSKLGKVAYEKIFPGGTRFADIYFESLNDPNCSFIADIRTVYDKGLDKSNPFQELFNEIMDRVASRNLRQNSFGLEVKGEHKGVGVNKKVKLQIPGKARFSQIVFNENFNRFIDIITKNPQMPARYPIRTGGIDISITYDPHQEYAYGHHSSYTEVFSLTQNPVYDALVDKRNQLIASNFKGPRGIFICDGDSDFLNSHIRSPGAVTADQVIQNFLSQNDSIYFVVTFIVGRMTNGTFIHNKVVYQTIAKLYQGQFFANMDPRIIKTLEAMPGMFPQPVINANNAVHFLRGPKAKEGRSHLGGLTVSYGTKQTEIKMSARALLELLSGKMDQERFFKAHGFLPGIRAGEPIRNPFEIGMIEGQMIDEITIEKSSIQDDDWIIIRLKGPDPAISAFIVPQSRTNHT